MTTAELRAVPGVADDLSVWPASTTRLAHGGLAVGGVSLAEIAERFDTPAYVLDEGEVRGRCRRYRDAFPEAHVLYAAKAFLSRAVVRWVDEEGLGLDVCSAGELELAVTAGFLPSGWCCTATPNRPTTSRPRCGSASAASSSTALPRSRGWPRPWARAATRRSWCAWSRASRPHGHEKIRTGTDDQKFGLSPVDGSAQEAIGRILGQPQLELVGLHCHIGSQIAEVEPYVAAVRRMVGLMARIRDGHRVTLRELDVGGGHGVAYRPGEAALDPTALARGLRTELVAACAAAGLPVPRLAIEPGRAIVGPAGVALYRVLAVKHTGARLFVAVDGGMSDNPRPALYGVRYAPRLIGRASAADSRTATVVGRHCEAGDVLAADVPL